MGINQISRVIVLLSLLQFAYAGDVSGRVTDAGSGDFLPGANVVLE